MLGKTCGFRKTAHQDFGRIISMQWSPKSLILVTDSDEYYLSQTFKEILLGQNFVPT